MANVRRRVKLAKERVRQSEREAAIQEAHDKERKRLLQKQQEQQDNIEDDYDGNESEEEERMLEISKRLNPVLLMVSSSSTNDPSQVSANLPPAAMAVSIMGAGARAASSRRPTMLPHPVQGSQLMPA